MNAGRDQIWRLAILSGSRDNAAMTHAQIDAFNEGLEAARILIERTATATRRDLPHAQLAEMIGVALDELSDGIVMLKRSADEAMRRSFGLVSS